MRKIGKWLWDGFKRMDKLLWIVMICISAYGLVLLKTVPGANYKTQFAAVLLGYVGAVILMCIDYRFVGRYWYIVAAFCVFLILLTLLFGKAVVGQDGVAAKAWIDLGPVTFQPSELMKIGFLVTFGKHLQSVKERGWLTRPLHVFLLACHAMIPMLLVHAQHDDGAAMIFACMFIFMMFAAGVQLRYFVGLAAVVAAAVPLLWKFVLKDYQKKRMLMFRNPESDPQGYGLQQLAGRLSIGSGQLTGRGLGEAPRVNAGAVPIQESDYIFSVAGESLGFVGCVAIIVLLLALMVLCVRDSRRASDTMGSSICVGFFAMVFAQAFFNLGMCLNLLPVMGVTLPFFSQGGSSSACLYLGIGLIQSVMIHRDKGRPKHLFVDD